jgi:hypothetical protein
MSACTNDSSTTSGTVALKASAISSTGKTSLTARSAVTSTVVLTDFKINIEISNLKQIWRMIDIICILS